MSEKKYGTFGPAVEIGACFCVSVAGGECEVDVTVCNSKFKESIFLQNLCLCFTDGERFSTNPVYHEDGKDTVPSKEYSLFTSELLDRAGYSYKRIKRRQQSRIKCSKIANRKNFNCTIVRTGGTTLYYENDIDSMLTLNDVICADNPQHFIHRENITLFQTETQEVSPGYTRLRLLKCDGKIFNEQIRSSLFETEPGSYFISSQYFTEAVKTNTMRNAFKVAPTNGPSIPFSDDSGISCDNVVCFKCVCPHIIKRWMSRPRSQCWPSPETLQIISLLDGHVVPVGSKGSQNMYREWRICYSLAELHLMRNLNETQLKVYILLKKMCKSVLNPVCKDLTSYIMKNIIFWVCEENGLDKFTQESIMDRLFDCIKYLRKCVDDNILQSYMIPERNLLAGRLGIEQMRKLACVLSDLLKERGKMFLRCEKLRDGMSVMYKTPKMLKEYSEKGNRVENLKLKMDKIAEETCSPGMSPDELTHLLLHHEQFNIMRARIDHLIQFDALELLLMGKPLKEIMDLKKAKLFQILS